LPKNKRKLSDVERFIGISIGGAKSDRTALTVLDFYTKQKKAFVVDVIDGIGPDPISLDNLRSEYTADQALLDLIEELKINLNLIIVDVPITLPPCFLDCDIKCSGYDKCKKQEVKWMTKQYQDALKKHKKIKHFTPYTQRPVELYFRYKFFNADIFQDESLGANYAPLVARVQYLKRHFPKNSILMECSPKLSLFNVSKKLKLSLDDYKEYKSIESGIHIREKIIEKIIHIEGIFIYERDLKKLISNIHAFDSFLCVWAGFAFYNNKVHRYPKDFPIKSGAIVVPEL
jgi:hypothetical protein